MRYEVLLTEGAERDLEGIYDYLASNGSREEADQVLDRLVIAAKALASFPDRGAHPKELSALGITTFRQVFFKPYRVIYRVMGESVVICLVADGRRDLQTLLINRLLAPGS